MYKGYRWLIINFNSVCVVREKLKTVFSFYPAIFFISVGQTHKQCDQNNAIMMIRIIRSILMWITGWKLSRESIWAAAWPIKDVFAKPMHSSTLYSRAFKAALNCWRHAWPRYAQRNVYQWISETRTWDSSHNVDVLLLDLANVST